MPPPMITGLYPYARGGAVHRPEVTLSEIPESLLVNPSYRDNLIILAGDQVSASQLRKHDLQVYRIFDDAPEAIQVNAAHMMKHWMCRWALGEFGEFLWVDWDTVMIKYPDDCFWTRCREHGTPKFVHIQNYWATVNCGIYYADSSWSESMSRSFYANVSEPNDELLWASVLPKDVDVRPEYWWGGHVVNLWNCADFDLITKETYFAHVKDLGWADKIRSLL